MLKVPLGATDETLYLSMLEASAKYFRIPKYQIYTEDELAALVHMKYEKMKGEPGLPGFIHILAGIREEKNMNLKGRSFLTLKDFTPDEIRYLVNLAAELKEKRKRNPGPCAGRKEYCTDFRKTVHQNKMRLYGSCK